MNMNGKQKKLKSNVTKKTSNTQQKLSVKNVKKEKSLFPEDSLTWTQETWEYMNE